MMTAGPGQSFIGGLHPLCGWEEGNAGEKQRRGRRCLRPCYWFLLCHVDRKKKLITSLMNRKLENVLQVAQLSQRDRAAGWVINGQKWKTGTERQYLRTI